MLAKRLGMTSKKAHKMLAAFQKRYGILESEQQQGRMQMKARCCLGTTPACCGILLSRPRCSTLLILRILNRMQSSSSAAERRA